MTTTAAELARRTVADIMQNVVVTVTQETPLAEVARLLWDEEVSGLPVVGTDGRPIGFASVSDVARFRAFGGPHGAVARDVMTAATFSVRPSTSVAHLARFLARAGVHHALVMEGGVLRGIVSAFDIVQEIAEHAIGDEPPLDVMPEHGMDDLEC